MSERLDCGCGYEPYEVRCREAKTLDFLLKAADLAYDGHSSRTVGALREHCAEVWQDHFETGYAVLVNSGRASTQQPQQEGGSDGER